ncbi:MAG: glycosyltransferase [Phycisphaerae bacterium]|nr:glycosyltransferase [Phycisphaerae bacterium]
MKEIVFISRTTIATGGIQGQIFNFAKKLYERKIFQPVLICPDRNCEFAKLFINAGFETFGVPMGPLKIISAAKKIMHIIKDRDVGVVHTPRFRESLIGRIVRAQMPDIRHILRAQTYIDCTGIWVASECFYHILDRATSKYVDLYIANGKYLKNKIVSRSGITPSKVEVVINGKDSIGQPDEPYDRPNEPLPKKIAMIANFRPVKGHDCLLNAMTLLKNQNLKITARLIGGSTNDSPGYMNEIKKLAHKLNVFDQIEFYGSTSDISDAVKNIPVVVLPSNSSEGVPNCILEAMSLRKLVIASEMNGVGEIIDDKKTGFLCRPRDHKGFADILKYVFTHKAADIEPMRNAGFEKWQREFTCTKMVNDFIEIYQKIGVL